MTRAILILTLMATQLLSVRGDALYLCVRNDGSTCCIDAGPDSCTCCHAPLAPASSDSCLKSDCGSHSHGQDHDLAVACCTDDAIPAPQFPAVGAVVGYACECTHIPLAAAAEQPTINSRQNAAFDLDFHAFLLAPLNQQREVVSLARDVSFQRGLGETPPIDFVLTVISTIVIRC